LKFASHDLNIVALHILKGWRNGENKLNLKEGKIYYVYSTIMSAPREADANKLDNPVWVKFNQQPRTKPYV